MDPALPSLFTPPDHRRVLNVLAEHVGRSQAIGQAELAEKSGLSPRKAREIVHEIIVTLKQPICSTYGAAGQAGYYLPADESESLAAAQALQSHALSILRRASVLRRITVEAAAYDLWKQARDVAAQEAGK